MLCVLFTGKNEAQALSSWGIQFPIACAEVGRELSSPAWPWRLHPPMRPLAPPCFPCRIPIARWRAAVSPRLIYFSMLQPLIWGSWWRDFFSFFFLRDTSAHTLKFR